jgi:predicted DNA-binding WGR domain protein
MRREFRLTEAGSTKFWSIAVQGTQHRVQSGTLGVSERTATRAYASLESSQRAAEKLIAEKLRQGYAEVKQEPAGPDPAPRPATVPSLAPPAVSLTAVTSFTARWWPSSRPSPRRGSNSHEEITGCPRRPLAWSAPP